MHIRRFVVLNTYQTLLMLAVICSTVFSPAVLNTKGLDPRFRDVSYELSAMITAAELIEKSPEPLKVTESAKIHEPGSLRHEESSKQASRAVKRKDPKAVKLPYHNLIVEAAVMHRLDPDLIKAIIMAESRYNPKAVSSRGAMGLMQLMPKTAEAYAVVDGFDPKQNIYAGVRYFRKLMDRFKGDVKLALAAYNAGMGQVDKYKGIPPFKVTRDYIKKVKRYLQAFKQNPSFALSASMIHSAF